MKFLQFASIVGKLKKVPRAGWLRVMVKDSESVVEHSYRLAMLAMFLAPELDLDQLKAVKLALIHDLAESEIGDIVTQIGGKTLPNLSDKVTKENNAMSYIARSVGKEELHSLFTEYEESVTPEARIVRQLDKLEMAIQAQEYEVEQELDLEEFFISARQDITHGKLKMILEELEKKRHEK